MNGGTNVRTVAKSEGSMSKTSHNTQKNNRNFFDDALKFVIICGLIALLLVMFIHFCILLPPVAKYFDKSIFESSIALYFNQIQSFITIVTGLLTLIIGATGIGSYLSFKKIKEEENKITETRKKLETLLTITESVYFDPVTASGSRNAIRNYSEAEKTCKDYALLYILRGEEYYYANDYKSAKYDFKHATEIDRTSSRAWYGLGQALFRLASISRNQDKEDRIWNEDLFYEKAKNLEMYKIETIIDDKDKAEVAIRVLHKALQYGYDESKILFEIGRIYEETDNVCAIEKYEHAYEKSSKKNVEAGFYYCSAWIRKNNKNLSDEYIKNELSEIIKILKIISQSLQTSLAYALLCYLYCITEDTVRAKRAFTETNDIAINELFYLPDSSCQPSPV